MAKPSSETSSALSSSTQSRIQSILDAVTSPKSNTGVSGLVFNVIDKNGAFLTQTCSGAHALSGPASKTSMTLDSVFYIASCTKMITGIACMQLVEQDLMQLDDHNWLYSICPELKAKKVLNETGTCLVDRTSEVTLRMLLSHTAGFGYTFFNDRLRDWSRPTGYDEFGGDIEDYLDMPLVNQPGSRWEYGINIDWAGIAVERVSGLRLDEYFKQRIFEPVGIRDISFVPSRQMRENLVTMQQKYVDGTFGDADHVCRRAVWHAERGGGGKGEKDIFHPGGAGCFARPSDYCLLLSTLLAHGISPLTNNRILTPASIITMFTNQIPHLPDFGRVGIPASKPWLTNPIPDMCPQKGDPPQGWGLTFMLTEERLKTGRGRGAGWWAGIINSFWWIDPERGVAGFLAGQQLPFASAKIMDAWADAEKAVYDGLDEVEAERAKAGK